MFCFVFPAKQTLVQPWRTVCPSCSSTDWGDCTFEQHVLEKGHGWQGTGPVPNWFGCHQGPLLSAPSCSPSDSDFRPLRTGWWVQAPPYEPTCCNQANLFLASLCLYWARSPAQLHLNLDLVFPPLHSTLSRPSHYPCNELPRDTPNQHVELLNLPPLSKLISVNVASRPTLHPSSAARPRMGGTCPLIPRGPV